MRFLANENMPGDVVAVLRAGGHDAVWVRQDAHGMRDSEILAWAMREDRILLTFDKDFGELAFAHGLPASCGIVLFRMPMPAASEAGTRLAQLIASRDDWAGNFAVIEANRIRFRALPAR